MSILDIRVLGDPILREETTPVEQITDELRTLAKNMFDTMRIAKGIGLAAPQVGRSERLAVIDVNDHAFVIINPEVVEADSKTAKAEEGCLSIPDVYACALSTWTDNTSRSKPTSCSGVACSTRSTICTASSSSTI